MRNEHTTTCKRHHCSRPELTILRSGEQGNEYIEASEETDLRPGDVMEIALTSGLIPKPGAHAEK